LVLQTGVGNFTPAAWWDHIKLGVKNLTKWNRIAVVGDQKGVAWSRIWSVFLFLLNTAAWITMDDK
jgi:hypothetical protein